MAALPGNTSYVLLQGSNGWRELDIMDKIINQSPLDRPFFELSGSVKANSWKHEWQVRTQRTRAISAYQEGGTYTFKNVAAPTRPSNTCQILTDGVEVSETSLAEGHYGVTDLMNDQINYQTKNHGLDIEYNLIRGLQSTGGTSGARQMGGLVSIITTNKTAMGGLTLTEAMYVSNLLQVIWNTTNDRPDTVMFPGPLANKVNAFNAFGATRWIDTTTREIVVQVLLYHSSFGTVTNYLCRDLTSGSTFSEILAFNRDMMHKAWLRTTKMMPVSQQSDARQAIIISELTLQYDNELATALMTGVNSV